MKTLALILFLAVAASAWGQTTILFNNRAIGAGVVAPVYGVNPSAPEARMSGNATTNGGMTDYTGIPLLFGTGYSAALYAGDHDSDPSSFRLLATAKFRTLTTTGGFWQTPQGAVYTGFFWPNRFPSPSVGQP